MFVRKIKSPFDKLLPSQRNTKTKTSKISRSAIKCTLEYIRMAKRRGKTT